METRILKDSAVLMQKFEKSSGFFRSFSIYKV
jgi:hypothetical protein